MPSKSVDFVYLGSPRHTSKQRSITEALWGIGHFKFSTVDYVKMIPHR